YLSVTWVVFLTEDPPCACWNSLISLSIQAAWLTSQSQLVTCCPDDGESSEPHAARVGAKAAATAAFMSVRLFMIVSPMKRSGRRRDASAGRTRRGRAGRSDVSWRCLSKGRWQRFTKPSVHFRQSRDEDGFSVGVRPVGQSCLLMVGPSPLQERGGVA